MKTILKIAIVSMMLINCSNDDNNCVCNNNSGGNDNNNDTPTTFEPQNIETRVMLKGFYDNISIEPLINEYKIIRTPEELNDMLSFIPYSYRAHPSIYNGTFDFEQHQIIAVFNMFPVASLSIDVTHVTEYENEIIVVVENYESDFVGILGGMLLFSAELVRMPKTDKPIVFDTSLLWTPYDD